MPPRAKKILKELPILLFFLYLVYICVIFHNRERKMPDYSLTFDHWWYFYHRLREGSFAQWNPFTLLGKIAVQWNHIPASIFSPFLVLSELTLETFHRCQVIGTFLSLSGIYWMGRILKYDRFYCLLPIVFLSTGGYKYFISFSHFATFLFLYPIAISFLLLSINSKEWGYSQNRLIFLILLCLSFLGFRLENIVYALVFISCVFFVLSLYRFRNRKKMLCFLAAGAIIIIVTVGLNTWQLSMLVNSILESHRFFPNEVHIVDKILDPIFIKWIVFSLTRQPALLMICFNLILSGIMRFVPRFSLMIITITTGVVIVCFELFLIDMSFLIQSKTDVAEILIFPIYKDSNIIFSWTGISATSLLISYSFFLKKKITMGKFFSLLTAAFAGFYIAEYSWHTWRLDIHNHFFFTTPFISSFMSLGAVNLLIKRKIWIVAVLVSYHFIGETGSLILFEIFNMPWNVPRAALMEIPFQAVLMLESVLFLQKIIFFLPLRRLKMFLLKPKTVHQALRTSSLIFAFLTIKVFLMPLHLDGKAYMESFPFAKTKVDEVSKKEINKNIYEAQKRAEQVRDAKSYPYKRIYVEDTVLNLEGDMCYKFMPAYSRTLNTAPLYSSEIPKAMNIIFNREATSGKYLRFHPEMNPLIFAYKASRWDYSIGGLEKLTDYVNQVIIFPHKNKNPLLKEIMAEEGTRTPRAFLTNKVIKLNNYTEEYNYLTGIIERGSLLTDQITTCEEKFSQTFIENNDNVPFEYVLKFEKDEPEHIVFKVSSNKNGYLALMDTWSRGWKAYIDGRETDIYRGYIGTRFVKVGAGEYIVEFKYRVPGLFVSAILSCFMWILLLIILIKTKYNSLKRIAV